MRAGEEEEGAENQEWRRIQWCCLKDSGDER